MNKELAEAVKLFISQPLNFPLSRGQIMEVARVALPILEQQERVCQKCGGTGMADSGAHTAGGKKIMVTCECEQERGEGEWVEWGGGDQPITGYKLVHVRLRDGTEYQHQMGCLYWEHNGLAADIIAYRIIPERATNQNGDS
ncbi:hypothetical protein ACR3LR_08360 [Pantoea eucalypti]|uniref:hypothetical protein n=1 Tax=Pantoea eucalypti TaxID=470933 RepID=UPI003EE69433